MPRIGRLVVKGELEWIIRLVPLSTISGLIMLSHGSKRAT